MSTGVLACASRAGGAVVLGERGGDARP